MPVVGLATDFGLRKVSDLSELDDPPPALFDNLNHLRTISDLSDLDGPSGKFGKTTYTHQQQQHTPVQKRVIPAAVSPLQMRSVGRSLSPAQPPSYVSSASFVSTPRAALGASYVSRYPTYASSLRAAVPQSARHYASPNASYNRSLTRSPPPPGARSVRAMAPVSQGQTPKMTPRSTYGAVYPRMAQVASQMTNSGVVSNSVAASPKYTPPRSGSYVAAGGYSQGGSYVAGGYPQSGSFVAPPLNRGMQQVRSPTISSGMSPSYPHIARSVSRDVPRSMSWGALSPGMSPSYPQIARAYGGSTLRAGQSFRA